MLKQVHVGRSVLGALGLAVGVTSAAPGYAEQVTLTSLDGSTTLQGEFLSYDGSIYTIRTLLGELEVSAFQVTCSGAVCPEINQGTDEFTIAGSAPLVGGVFDDLIIAYSAELGGKAEFSTPADGGITLAVQDEAGRDAALVNLMPVGSAAGIAEVAGGDAALAISTRPVSDAEAQTASSAGRGDLRSETQQTIFALDGLVAVTSQANPVRAISESDLARILAGQVTNWSQVGGPSANINLYLRAPDSGTAVVVEELLMKPAGLSVKADAFMARSDAELANAVSADPLGIGITSLAGVGDAKILAIRGVCGIQVPATPFTIKTEEYPLSRRVFAYSSNQPKSPQLARFMQFLETPAAQNVISNAGFVDLGISSQTNDQQGQRYLASMLTTDVEVTLPQLRAMTSALTAADRTSITFRFALGSSQLDARAQDDILRLANLVATGDIVNKELLLIGYTDSIGDGESNIRLSQQRAEEVRQALISAAPAGSLDGLPITALGFGEISPLSCNETDNGRRINRRVEVWFRDVVTESR